MPSRLRWPRSIMCKQPEMRGYRAQTAMGLLHGFFSLSRAWQTRQRSLVPTESASQARQRSMVGHHAHCRMSFIFPADCTIVSAYRSASKVDALEKLYVNSDGTKSACIAAPKDRKHRLTNSHRPNDATSLQCFAPRGRLDPTPG
jgi:hypothetical protein